MSDVTESPVQTEAAPSLQELGRMDRWWYSKVAPVLAVSYCASLWYGVGAWATAETILTICFVGLCAGSYGHLVNDAFDVEVDARAGKRNHLARFEPWQRFSICAGLLLLGFLPAVFVPWSRTSLLLLAVEYLLPTMYSAPPLRFKGRGALGLVCDCFGAHLVPCLYVISLMAHQGHLPMRSHLTLVSLVALWALCLGIKGILIHEFEDRDNDLRSGIKTFATETAFDQVRGVGTGIYVLELLSFVALAGAMVRIAPLLIGLILLYAVAVTMRVRAYWSHYHRVDEETTLIQWWQMSHAFYETYFPLAVAIQCAWRHPWLAVFAMLQFGVFATSFHRQLPALKEIWWLLWLGGRLDLSERASAHANAVTLPWPGSRIVIERAGSEQWEVRVVRPGVRIRAGGLYRMVLRVRADEPRRLMFGVWQDHAPWHGLGHCEVLEVLPKWQTIHREFLAVENDRHGCLAVWLGGDTVAVDFGGWGIRRVSARKY